METIEQIEKWKRLRARRDALQERVKELESRVIDLFELHGRDSAELARLCKARDGYRSERDAIRGLAKWASGRLIDAGDAESAQQVLDLAGQGPADDSAATIAGLRRFAVRVMESWPDGGVDGGYLQDVATECGLLSPVMVSAPCGESCACAEFADSMPFECYRKTALLTGAALRDKGGDA
jgi:hypothetical protein